MAARVTPRRIRLRRCEVPFPTILSTTQPIPLSEMNRLRAEFARARSDRSSIVLGHGLTLVAPKQKWWKR